MDSSDRTKAERVVQHFQWQGVRPSRRKQDIIEGFLDFKPTLCFLSAFFLHTQEQATRQISICFIDSISIYLAAAILTICAFVQRGPPFVLVLRRKRRLLLSAVTGFCIGSTRRNLFIENRAVKVLAACVHPQLTSYNEQTYASSDLP